MLAHLAIAVWAWTADVDTGETLVPSVAQRFYQETIDVRLPDEPVVTQPGVADPVAPHQVAPPIVKPVAIRTPVHSALPEPDAVRMAMLLTGSETAPTGAGDMNRRRPGGDLDKQIAAIGNQPVTVGRHLPTQAPRLGTDQGPVLTQPQLENLPVKQDRDPGRIVVVPSKHPTGTTLTADTVLAKIQHAYVNGLQRCYQQGLVSDATLSGRVSLAFTIDEAGHTVDGDATGMTDKVDSCIQRQLSTWQFPVPRDTKTAQPTEMPFALVLVLQSS